MTENPLNPYSPPETSSQPIFVHEHRKSNLPAVFVGLATTAYIVFTLINLAASGVDRKAGMLLLINVPTLLAWSILLLHRKGSYRVGLGCLAVGVQALIMLIMLVTGIGDTGPVILINGILASIIAVLTAICFGFQRASRSQNFG